MKKLKIALVMCPCWSKYSAPLGLAYICAASKLSGHEVRSFDINIELFNDLKNNKVDYWHDFMQYKWEHPKHFVQLMSLMRPYLDKKIEEIISYDPDIAGFSVFSTTFFSSLYVAEEIKKRNPRCKIVFGGPKFTNFAIAGDYVSKYCIDALVIGEGEYTFREFLDHYAESGALRESNGVVVKGRAVDPDRKMPEPIRDLDALPFPDFSSFDLSLYKESALSIMTSRGCVAKCTFCSECGYWHSFRHRSADNIFRELKKGVSEYGIKKFFFNDSLINGNIAELSKLLDLIIDNKLGIDWGGYVRVSKHMTPDIFTRLRKAGCTYLSFGVESGSQKVLDDMNKMITVQDAAMNLADATSAGIETHVNWIVGFPTESWLDYLKSLWFIFRNKRNIFFFCNGQSGCGLSQSAYLISHPEEFGISKHKFLGEWRTTYFRNTIIHRKLKGKILMFFLNVLKIRHP